MKFCYDIGNKADHLTYQSREQHCNEDNKYHRNCGSENGDNVLTHRVVVCYLSTEYDQAAEPNEGNGGDQGNDSELGVGNYVREDGCGDEQHGYGKQAVRASDENILEASFTLEQGGKTPVCENEEEERNKNTDCLDQNRGISVVGVEKITLTNRLIVESDDGNKDINDSSSNRTSALVLEVPESIEGMEDQVEAVRKLLPEGSLSSRSCNLEVELCDKLAKE